MAQIVRHQTEAKYKLLKAANEKIRDLSAKVSSQTNNSEKIKELQAVIASQQALPMSTDLDKIKALEDQIDERKAQQALPMSTDPDKSKALVIDEFRKEMS